MTWTPSGSTSSQLSTARSLFPMMGELWRALRAKIAVGRAFCRECGGPIEKRYRNDTCSEQCADEQWTHLQI
jgi:hypothetical protein